MIYRYIHTCTYTRSVCFLFLSIKTLSFLFFVPVKNLLLLLLYSCWNSFLRHTCTCPHGETYIHTDHPSVLVFSPFPLLAFADLSSCLSFLLLMLLQPWAWCWPLLRLLLPCVCVDFLFFSLLLLLPHLFLLSPHAAVVLVAAD